MKIIGLSKDPSKSISRMPMECPEGKKNHPILIHLPYNLSKVFWKKSSIYWKIV
jgi:hypothetical protein